MRITIFGSFCSLYFNLDPTFNESSCFQIMAEIENAIAKYGGIERIIFKDISYELPIDILEAIINGVIQSSVSQLLIDNWVFENEKGKLASVM